MEYLTYRYTIHRLSSLVPTQARYLLLTHSINVLSAIQRARLSLVGMARVITAHSCIIHMGWCTTPCLEA